MIKVKVTEMWSGNSFEVSFRSSARARRYADYVNAQVSSMKAVIVK